MKTVPRNSPVKVRKPDKRRLKRIARERGWSQAETVCQALNALEKGTKP